MACQRLDSLFAPTATQPRRHKCFMHFSCEASGLMAECRMRSREYVRINGILSQRMTKPARDVFVIRFFFAPVFMCTRCVFVRRTHFTNNDDDDEKTSESKAMYVHPDSRHICLISCVVHPLSHMRVSYAKQTQKHAERVKRRHSTDKMRKDGNVVSRRSSQPNALTEILYIYLYMFE